MEELEEKLKNFEFDEVWCIGGATLYKDLIQEIVYFNKQHLKFIMNIMISFRFHYFNHPCRGL